jgi:mannitol/fructose-specific phosphotransferase system IIA component (Ntr-type)
MIVVILFLDIESLVKTASLLKILLFLFILLSVIIMRESRIRHYRPKFSSPFYPYIQIIGILGLIFLIIQMGVLPMVLVSCFVLFGFLWYWFYARDKIWREFSLMHVVERLTGEKSTTRMTDQELREILIDRDEIDEQRFKQLMQTCTILDLYKYLPPDDLFHIIAKKLSEKVHIKEKTLFRLLKSRSSDSNVVIHPGMAIVSTKMKGHNKFEIVLVRTKKGLVISKDIDPIHCIFIILATPDFESFYYHCLMWLVQISDDPEFEKRWVEAEDEAMLRDIILTSWKRRESK